jgi:palmitoyl transferase
LFTILKKTILFFFILAFTSKLFAASEKEYCQAWPAWIKPVCSRLNQIWYEGDNELYITGYAWHNRYRYSPERVKTYNENAWGGGLGKSLIDEKGNWHGLYAFAFSDSHKNMEPILGYAWQKLFSLNQDLKTGIGLSAFLTQRPDINNGIPFPGALPWLSVLYKRVTLSATYIPGHQDIGNVLFVFAKYRF